MSEFFTFSVFGLSRESVEKPSSQGDDSEEEDKVGFRIELYSRDDDEIIACRVKIVSRVFPLRITLGGGGGIGGGGGDSNNCGGGSGGGIGIETFFNFGGLGALLLPGLGLILICGVIFNGGLIIFNFGLGMEKSEPDELSKSLSRYVVPDISNYKRKKFEKIKAQISPG